MDEHDDVESAGEDDRSEEPAQGGDEVPAADDVEGDVAVSDTTPPTGAAVPFAVPDPDVANRAVFGRLVLHYPDRDVTTYLDGNAALRVLAMFAQRREGDLGDFLVPGMSSASTGWLVLDLDEPLAMTWLPGMPQRPRTTVDPVRPADCAA